MSRNVVIRPALPFLAILLTAVPAIPLTGVPVRATNDFGVTIEFYRDADKQAELMAAAGVSWVRIDLAWSSAEPEAGRYDFRIWDRFLDSFEPHGIRVLFILDYGNRLYQDGLPPSTESGRAAFAAFAGAAARHFRGRAAWEIWNEPNLPQFWAGAPDPAAYVALARAAAAEIPPRGSPGVDSGTVAWWRHVRLRVSECDVQSGAPRYRRRSVGASVRCGISGGRRRVLRRSAPPNCAPCAGP